MTSIDEDLGNGEPHSGKNKEGLTNSNNSRSSSDNKIVPRVVRTSFGHELGDVVAMSIIPREKLSDWEIASIGADDARNKALYKNWMNRRMGGHYEEHPRDMLSLYFDIVSNTRGISLDYKVIRGILIHDYVENHPQMIDKGEQFKKISHEMRTSEDPSPKLGRQIKTIMDDIATKRFVILREMLNDDIAFIHEYDPSHTEAEASQRHTDSLKVISVVDALTRYSELSYFQESAHLMHRLYTKDDYENSTGFQDSPDKIINVALMEKLGLEGHEPIDVFLMRIGIRALDRTALTGERGKRFTPRQATELERLMQQNSWLHDMYGNIDFRGEDMPRPYLLNLVYRNFVVLSNLDVALSNIEHTDSAYSYGKIITDEAKKDASVKSYLKFVFAARGYLIKETQSTINDLIKSYESESLLGPHLREIHSRVKENRPGYYRRVSGSGPISRGFSIDTNPDTNWSRLDYNGSDKRSVLAMAENYEDALVFNRLLGHFADRNKNKIDLNKGHIKLFFIYGLEGTPKLDMKPYQS